MAKGLEKNKPLPATGVVNDLKTTTQLRPGVSNDKLIVPIYQVDDFSEAEGKSASLYEHVADVEITGDDVDALITENTPVDVTLKVDSSEQMRLEVHFLATDTTVEKDLDTSRKHTMEETNSEIQKGIREAERGICQLSSSDIDTSDLQSDFEAIKADNENTSEKKEVLSHLRELLRKIERLDSSTEWQRTEAELRDEFDRLEKAQNDLGNAESAQIVEHLRGQVDRAIRSKNVSVAREVLEQVQGQFVQLTLVYQCMGFIDNYNKRFNTVRWKDTTRARQLINRGLEEMQNQPSVERLHPIVCALIELMPNDEAANAGGLLK